jgi:hypothetical protein
LSMPLGPIVERTVSARILAAIMLFLWASLPLDREVPSFKIRTRISHVSNHISNIVRDKASYAKRMEDGPDRADALSACSI